MHSSVASLQKSSLNGSWLLLAAVACMLASLFFLLRSARILRQVKKTEPPSTSTDTVVQQQVAPSRDADNSLISAILNEFRTPLTLILAALHRVVDQYKGDQTVFQKLLVAEKNTGALLSLLKQVEELKKLEKKAVALKAQKTNLVSFLQKFFSAFQQVADEKNLKLDFQTESDEVFVYIDHSKMRSMLQHMLEYTLEQSSQGDAISFQVVAKEESVVISIVRCEPLDTKSEEPKTLVDEMDAEVDIVATSTIALSLVGELAAIHSGTFKQDNDFLEKSNRLMVSLPLGSEHLKLEEIVEEHSEHVPKDPLFNGEAPEPAELPSFDEADLTSAANDKTVLIVEDNQEVRRLICSLLKDENHRAVEAINGKEGLAIARKMVPDLIISDVMMPEMDGVEFCKEIRSHVNTSHIPLILLTAKVSDAAKLQGLASGANDYIAKPFEVDELVWKVNNLLTTTGKKQQSDVGEILTLGEANFTSIDEKLLKEAIEIIERRMSDQDFDIAEFCSEIGLSRTMLFAKVKNWTGLTPNEFIQSIRMKRAAQFLERKKANISEISFEVGYKSPKYFSKIFQKYYGMTPSAYAKQFDVNT